MGYPTHLPSRLSVAPEVTLFRALEGAGRCGGFFYSFGWGSWLRLRLSQTGSELVLQRNQEWYEAYCLVSMPMTD